MNYPYCPIIKIGNRLYPFTGEDGPCVIIDEDEEPTMEQRLFSFDRMAFAIKRLTRLQGQLYERTVLGEGGDPNSTKQAIRRWLKTIDEALKEV